MRFSATFSLNLSWGCLLKASAHDDSNRLPALDPWGEYVIDLLVELAFNGVVFIWHVQWPNQVSA